ncbi:MAG: DUF3100 domain-containing protein [Bifidobacteriaceae bacterium]|jgi:MFS family permease|nr:DUF3100 domain-containing protein [Bifidobacteriaceae bacterium]MCI1979083.1 DUF3100 domain-containing protein [Bifidobacteriaceae bacterium]
MSVAQTVSPALETTPRSKRLRGIAILIIAALAISCGSQLIGELHIPLGSVEITILPMVWAILLGGLVSAQKIKPFSVTLQNSANSLVSVAVLLVMASLSFSIGPNLGIVVSAGPALLLQEVGHLIGTLVLALPLALILGMGPATIGATFSIDREGSFAMVSERYGSDSAEYRGVLSMYIFGTVFGAVVISLLVSIVTSLHWFNPQALAMGAGVGSGSMMGAATAVIAEEYPALADQVKALAATSNVITTLLGVYVGFFVALPLAHKIYHWATRNKDSWIAKINDKGDSIKEGVQLDTSKVTDKGQSLLGQWSSVAIVMCLGIPVAWITDGKVSWESVACYAIFAALIYFGMLLHKFTKIPALLTVVTLGVLLTSPWSPVSGFITAVSGHVLFTSICTIMLSLAGLSLGKDLGMLKQISWKIIPVGLVAILSSYIFSVCVAEFVLGYW